MKPNFSRGTLIDHLFRIIGSGSKKLDFTGLKSNLQQSSAFIDEIIALRLIL